MGREIRRVPAEWCHPKDERGFFLPLHDEDIGVAGQRWLSDCFAWERGDDPAKQEQETEKGRRVFFWEWDGWPPDPDCYRPKWTDGERTHFQIYETVSEGTPVSPVFESREQLAAWLVEQGHSEDAARSFSVDGWAPSFVIADGRMYSNIESAALPKREAK